MSKNSLHRIGKTIAVVLNDPAFYNLAFVQDCESALLFPQLHGIQATMPFVERSANLLGGVLK